MSNLVVNPFASIELTRERSAPVGLRVSAPFPGRGRLTTAIDSRLHPRLFQSLRALAESARSHGRGRLELDETEVSVLREAGYLVPPSEVPQAPRFGCLLGEDLPAAGRKPRLAPGTVVVTGFKLLTAPPRLPREKRHLGLLGLTGRLPLALVRDAVTGITAVHEVPGWLVGACTRLRPGGSAPTLTPREFQALRAARILLSQEELTRERATWRYALDSARILLEHRGYANMAGLFHPAQMKALRAYYRGLVSSGLLVLGDPQSLRYVRHNDPVSSFFHEQLAGVVSNLFDVEARPSYNYLGCYQPGARLARHTDRAQCRFSGTLLVDFTSGRTGPGSWPLVFSPPGGRPGTLHQTSGECAFYRGCDIPHARPTLPEGCRSTSLFLHYVPRTFRGALS
ncbi:hypothetical protein D7Y15_02230 [Corallococcus sp. AB030]|uniref:hypothetical protein n=1 Tax=Corallococcus sp. AB030 TaxID=2316716 RepID=UPI000ED80346|nr:hypothetical protein [Corallococcus sp. AB030]RKI19930.1 hypothetical protein D7Y15_02230 [Corallococcus sp. AB030]